MSSRAITYKAFQSPKVILSKPGLFQVFIRAIKDRDKAEFGTGIYLKPEQWNNEKQQVTGHPDKHALNRKIEEIQQRLKNLENAGRQTNLDYSTTDLRRNYKQQDIKAFTHFAAFALDQLERDRSSIANRTYLNRRQAITSFQDFAKGRDQFGAITYALLDDYFKQYLPAEFLKRFTKSKGKTIAPGTVHKHWKIIRQYEQEAVERGFLKTEQTAIASYNRNGKNIKATATERAWLEPYELAKLEAYEIPADKDNWHQIRDFYLLMCYTGLRFSDAASITKKNFKETPKGLVMTFIAGKTGKKLDLPLWLFFRSKDGQPDTRPERLVKKYWKDNGKPFFKTSNQSANRLMKPIAEAAGITGKNLTQHTARHTFATFLITRLPAIIVRDLLQHSKIETTMIYAHQSKLTIWEKLEAVEDW
jgi:integrase